MLHNTMKHFILQILRKEKKEKMSITTGLSITSLQGQATELKEL